MRLTGNSLMVKSSEFREAIKTTKIEISKVVTSLGGKHSVPFRIPVTATVGSRCYKIPVTNNILLAYNGKNDNVRNCFYLLLKMCHWGTELTVARNIIPQTACFAVLWQT